MAERSRLRRRSQVAASLSALALVVGACGSSGTSTGSGTASATATTAATAATDATAARETDSAGTSAPATSAVGPSPEAQAAMAAWAVVFDSAADFGQKAPHLADAASLEASNAAYAAAGEASGGISLEPTAAVIEGSTATITYDVLFGSAAAYSDLNGEITSVDGTWVVSRETYCGFLASARTPCQ